MVTYWAVLRLCLDMKKERKCGGNSHKILMFFFTASLLNTKSWGGMQLSTWPRWVEGKVSSEGECNSNCNSCAGKLWLGGCASKSWNIEKLLDCGKQVWGQEGGWDDRRGRWGWQGKAGAGYIVAAAMGGFKNVAATMGHRNSWPASRGPGWIAARGQSLTNGKQKNVECKCNKFSPFNICTSRSR